MAHCRVLLCNLNKKSASQGGNFLFISNKHLVTFHFPLAIYLNRHVQNPDNICKNPSDRNRDPDSGHADKA